MDETFPIKPLFDKVIVREIPLSEYFDQGEQNAVVIATDNANINVRSDRAVVVAVGDSVEQVKAGDVVVYDPDFCTYDPIYLNPADKFRHDLPTYWQIRVHDLKGILVA